MIKSVGWPAILLPHMKMQPSPIYIFFLSGSLLCSGGFLIWTKQIQQPIFVTCLKLTGHEGGLFHALTHVDNALGDS